MMFRLQGSSVFSGETQTADSTLGKASSTVLAEICECGEKDIDLGPYYEIFDLDPTPRSPGMSREEMKNVMELILSHERMKAYGASW